MTIKRLVVVDSSFDGAMGHHRLLNQNLLTIADRRGLEPVLLCGGEVGDLTGFPDSADIRPIISHGIYHRFGRHGVERVLGFNRRALDNLRALPADLFDEHTAVYVHTTTEVEVLALSTWLNELAEERGVRSVLSMMFPPFGAEVSAAYSPSRATITAAVYRRALEAIYNQPLITVAAYGAGLASTYQQFSGQPCPILPAPILPLEPTAAEPVSDAEAQPSVLLYAGDGRNDKGLHLTAAVARQLLAADVDLDITIQVSGVYALQHEAALAEISMLAKNSELNFIDGRVDPDAYKALWLRTELVCCFYDAREYAFKTSGVGWEAMQYGVPAVLAPGLWHAAEFDYYGHPHVDAEAYWPDELADAVLRAAKDRARLAALASQSSERFLLENEVSQLLAPVFDDPLPTPNSAPTGRWEDMPLYEHYLPAFAASGF